MKPWQWGIFPSNDPEQVLRLRRFFVGSAIYLMTVGFVLLCWAMGFLDNRITAIYTATMVASNLIFYTVLRSGLNKRFKDPSLTTIQIMVSAAQGMYAMYFAGPARSAFLLLGVALFSFGMFRLNMRGFLKLAVGMLLVYATMVVAVAHFQADRTDLRLELLLWIAFAMALAQFSLLAGMVSDLRHKVSDKNRALAKQNAELEVALQRISDMAIRDELTGVYNRRYLMERITEETARCQRSGATFCLCMVDIDFFKKINDGYGHLGGDEVLRSVARTASGALREGDFFGRYGGEEFAILLTNTTLEGAMITAERVRTQIQNLRFPEVHVDLRVTISLGVAEHVRQALAAATLQRADEALYSAKHHGRNRSVAAQVSA
ncbi:MAG: GGDEF domain-containing protein [Rhodoferax sp.]